MIWPSLGEERTQLHHRSRLVLDQCTATRCQLIEIDTLDPGPVRRIGGDGAIHDRLRQGAQDARVLGRHEMDGAAHDDDPDNRTIEQQCRKRIRDEPFQA